MSSLDEPRSQTDRVELDRRTSRGCPPQRIILFGSQARGDATPHSDFDIMVVEEKPADRFAEMVRLNRLIRSFDIAVDLLVVSDEKFEYWRETPGNVYYEAATRGQVLYQAA